MAKFRTLQSAMNAGELSPKLRGRTEIPRYQHGLELNRNALPIVEGGSTRIDGTRFVAHASGDVVLLVSFKSVISGSLYGWDFEFGDELVRFFKEEQPVMAGEVPYEVVTPYTAADLAALRYDQSENMLYLWHPLHHPKRLVRTADDEWILEDVPITNYPYQRPPGTQEITLSPSATSGDISITASADFFVAGHVGLTFIINSGLVEITAVNSPTDADATVLTTIISGQSVLTRRELTAITITSDFVQLINPAVVDINIDTQANYDSKTINTTHTPSLPIGITLQTVSTSATLTGTEADQNWKEVVWSDLRGWPRCGTFFEQRLIMAGSATYPTHVWGSKIADPLNLTIGTLDNEGFSLPLAAATTPITDIFATDKLYVMTYDKEITLSGGDKPLTPTNYDIKAIGNYGSSTVARAVKVGDSFFFASPSGKQLRSFEYQLNNNRYLAPDYGIFGSHFLKAGNGIKTMAYSRTPQGGIWCITNNGDLITLTVDKEQEVSAWAKHGTTVPHAYVSVSAGIKSNGDDKVCFAVRRKIGNAWQTCIEYLDSSMNTACGLKLTGTSNVEWTVAHLNGAQVDIVANGFVSAPQTVAENKITLPYPATSVEVGLNYVTTIKDLPLDLAQQGMTAQGSNMAVAKIRVRLHETSGCMINGERLSFQKFGAEVLDQPVQTFTGDKQVQAIGRGPEPADSQVTIIQDKPLPLTVLAIIKQVAIND